MGEANFIVSLIIVSEKAATIARICRRNDRLLSLLVEEKTTLKKNNICFVADFKTLADVLIQEMIRHDLEKKFPTLKGFIYGEEENVFTNARGETVALALNDDKSHTMALLTKILNGDVDAARSLTDVVHEHIAIEDVPVLSLQNEIPNLNIDNLALWIDPIDATTEYINGKISDPGSVPRCGLTCVTVLIGAFNKVTGLPVVGVINQPFYQLINSDSLWKGCCIWGLSQDGYNVNSVVSIETPNRKPLIAVSLYEDDHIKEKLLNAGFDLVSVAGAGNKCLCVILGKLDAYVLSQKSTYYWDTCAVHAVLKSLQGNMWNYEEAMKNNLVDLHYREKRICLDTKEYINKGGFIAYRNEQLGREIVSILQ